MLNELSPRVIPEHYYILMSNPKQPSREHKEFYNKKANMFCCGCGNIREPTTRELITIQMLDVPKEMKIRISDIPK